MKMKMSLLWKMINVVFRANSMRRILRMFCKFSHEKKRNVNYIVLVLLTLQHGESMFSDGFIGGCVTFNTLVVLRSSTFFNHSFQRAACEHTPSTLCQRRI